jgi:hypothetical protein
VAGRVDALDCGEGRGIDGATTAMMMTMTTTRKQALKKEEERTTIEGRLHDDITIK